MFLTVLSPLTAIGLLSGVLMNVGKWDVYFMNSSGGEVRRITQDSSDNVNVTHISRDGSWILYDRSNLGKSEIAIVPTLGGIY